MLEPLTFLPGLLATVAGTVVSGIAGNEAHRLYRQWLETAIDPDTGLPRNHDLNRASRESLRGAVQVLLMELAGRLDPKKPWCQAIQQHLKDGKLGSVPLVKARTDPQWTWLEHALTKVRGNSLDVFHDQIQLSNDQVRDSFREGEICNSLGRALPEQLIAWLGREIDAGQPPPEFGSLIRDGWEIHQGQPRRITLAHAYCLFFREHLKADPKVFNIFTADTLNALSTRLGQQGEKLAGELERLNQAAGHTQQQIAEATTRLAELKHLREAVQKLAAQPPVFSQFEAWLTPQLGDLKELLADLKDQLDALARGQGELRESQGEMLVELTVLRSEVARGQAGAKAVLTELSTHLTRLEGRLDYFIGGLPIQRFLLPDPPTRELDLLLAKHRIVPLLGRDTDLASLCEWVESGETISARLLVGGAGTGKTRLGFELLLRVGAALPGWQAGLLGGTDLRRLVERIHSTDFNWPAPTLLVVDYAQTLAAPLRELLQALTYKRSGPPPLRLLLLERQPGDWFDDLLRHEDGVMPCRVGRLFHSAEPVSLTSLPPGALRRDVLCQTLGKAAQLAGKPTPSLPPPGTPDFEQSLARPLFDQPLNLMLAALVAGELGLLTALRRERIDLAEHLAERELIRIGRFARDPNSVAQRRALRHLAACATLERGFTREELNHAVPTELAALQIQWPEGPGDLADCLRRALPGEHLAVAPVEPDFVGEALVLAALARADGTGPGRWRDWCEVVERCFRRDARNTPATLLHAFQNFGHQLRHGEPLLAAADALIHAGLADTESGLLLGLEGAMPYQTVDLRSRAADVTRHLYDRLKTARQLGRDDLTPEVARLANNLAIRLKDLGQPADALAPAQEAVDLYSILAGKQPEAFNPALGYSLTNLAIILGDLGRHAEGLAPAEEAVDHHRALARQQPDAFNRGLAGSLNNLANMLGGLGRNADALTPAQEAVDINRTLACQQPDAFNPDLAMSLSNLANRLIELGRRADALTPAQEAVDRYRDLARQQPDAFNPDLASSLNNLATILGDLGRRSDAFAPAHESADLYRALARKQPDAFNPTLAMSLQNLAICLGDLGRRAEAIAPAREAVNLYHALARQQPNAFNRNLAGSLNTLAIQLSKLGHYADALTPAQESVNLYRDLSIHQPDAFNPVLAMSLSNLAKCLSELSRRAHALAPAKESVDLYRALAHQQPDAFNPPLASSLINLANILGRLNRRTDALAPAQEAVNLRRALAHREPDVFNPDLAMSLNNLAIRLSDLGLHVDALSPAEESVALYRAVACMQPEAFIPDLASSLNNLANRLRELGRRADALAPAQEAVHLRRALALQQPDAFTPDLAMSLGMMGQV